MLLVCVSGNRLVMVLSVRKEYDAFPRDRCALQILTNFLYVYYGKIRHIYILTNPSFILPKIYMVTVCWYLPACSKSRRQLLGDAPPIHTWNLFNSHTGVGLPHKSHTSSFVIFRCLSRIFPDILNNGQIVSTSNAYLFWMNTSILIITFQAA